MFRANLISRAAAKIPAREIRASASASAADSAASAIGYSASASASDSAASAIGYSAASAASASGAAASASTVDSASASASTVDSASASASAADSAASAAIWEQLRLDVDWLLLKGATALLRRPLWNEAPGWWQASLGEFRKILPASEWQVWFDWYDSIAAGRPAFGLPAKAADALEKRIALGDHREGFWDRKPKAINAEIAGWVAEVRAIQPPKRTSRSLPSQKAIKRANPQASNFVQGPTGQIALEPDPPHPAADRARQNLREVFEDSQEVVGALHALGPNRLGHIHPIVEDLHGYLQQGFDNASINRIWSRVSRLRGAWDAHELAATQPEQMRDRDVILEPQCATLLRNALHQVNVFLAFDERGRELDRLKHGPEARDRSEEMLDRAAPIVLNIRNIAEGATVNIVIGDHNDVRALAQTIHGDQEKLRVALQDENFVIEVLKIGWRVAKAIQDSGSGASVAEAIVATAGRHGPDIVRFIAVHADHLKHFVELWETGTSVIEIINAVARIAKMLI